MNFQLIAYEGKDTPRYENGAIYAVRCKANGCHYIGATGLPYTKRFGQHKYKLRKQCHSNPKLQEAYDQYGKNAFEYFILDDGYHSDFQLDLYEPHIIDWYRPKVFNLESGGKSGKYHSVESKKKDSLAKSHQMTKTGLYRIQKKNDSHCKQGFRWEYQYYDNGKRKSISSTDLFKLKQRVLDAGFEWRILDGVKLERTLKDLIPIN